MFTRFLIGALLIMLASAASAASRTVAAGPVVMWVDNRGNDDNDGLSPEKPKQHYCKAIHEMYNNWDFAGHQPYLFATSGQQFNEMCSSGGMLVGAVSIIVAPYDAAHPSSPGNIVPAPNFIRSCSPTSPVGPCGSVVFAKQWCDGFGDFGIRIYYPITWIDCNHWNAIGGAAVMLHNPAVVDFFGFGTIFRGSGSNDVAVLADGAATISVEGGATFEGQYIKGYLCNRHCDASISGPISLVGANVDGIYGMYNGSNLDLAATYSKDAISIVGPSVSSGFANVSTNGTTIMGGMSPQFGGQFCPGSCASPYDAMASRE